MIRSIVSNWGALVITGVISFALTPVLVHSLGDFHYGLWILVGSILDYYGLLDLGIRTTLHRFVARLKGTNQRSALNDTVATALGISLAVCFLVVCCTLVLMHVLPVFFPVQGSGRMVFSRLVLLLGASLALQFPARVLGAYLCGLQRFDLYNLTAIFTAIARATFLVLVLRWGYGVLGVGAVTLGISGLSCFLNWRLVRWADPEVSLRWWQASAARARELGSYSFYAFLNTLGDYLRLYTNSVVIARVLTIALVTPFSIAERLMELFRMVVFGLAGPLMPRMSELDGQARPEELRELFLRSTKATTLLSLFIGSLFLLNGQTLLRLWLGERFQSVYPLLLLLTGSYVVTLAQYPSNVVIYAKGRHRPLGWWTLSEGVANVLLSVYLGRKFGLWGVALGTTIPMLVIGFLIQPRYVLSLVGVTARQYVQDALARPMLAGALFLGLCHVAPYGKLHATAGTFALSLAAQTGLFALLAVSVGLTAAERHSVSERFREWAGLALPGLEPRSNSRRAAG